MIESPTYDLIKEEGVREGLEKGIEKGIEKGVERGIEKGRLEGLKEGILLALELKFGPQANHLFESIQKTTSLDTLKAVETTLRKTADVREIEVLLG